MSQNNRNLSKMKYKSSEDKTRSLKKSFKRQKNKKDLYNRNKQLNFQAMCNVAQNLRKNQVM